MMSGHRYLTVIVGLLLYRGVAQMQPKVDKPISPDSRISVSTSESSPDWKAFTEAIALPNEVMREISFVAANNSDKPVMAMAIIWEVTTSLGHKQLHKLFSDNYLLATPHPLIPPHSAVLILPYLVLRPGQVPPAKTYQDSFDNWSADFRGAVEIQVHFDSVIFGDGEVGGPNVYRLDQRIMARKDAAKALVSMVRQAQARGDAPGELLSALASKSAEKSDKMHMWQRRFAQQLLHSRDIEPMLQYLERLSAPPAFVPNDRR
jgi:hypothetical protein